LSLNLLSYQALQRQAYLVIHSEGELLPEDVITKLDLLWEAIEEI
jgi:hypothetical protein